MINIEGKINYRVLTHLHSVPKVDIDISKREISETLNFEYVQDGIVNDQDPIYRCLHIVLLVYSELVILVFFDLKDTVLVCVKEARHTGFKLHVAFWVYGWEIQDRRVEKLNLTVLTERMHTHKLHVSLFDSLKINL